MKNLKIFYLFLFLLIGNIAISQTGFNYQAVARDGSGNLLTDQNLDVRFSIFSDVTVFEETYNVTTDDHGLFNLVVGGGSADYGNIPWGSNSYDLKVEISVGGASFVDLGASPIVAVPIAAYAMNVENADDADANPTNELQSLSLSGNNLSLSDGNTIVLPTGSGAWTQVDTNIMYNDGKVNIGGETFSPNSKLNIFSTTPQAGSFYSSFNGLTNDGILKSEYNGVEVYNDIIGVSGNSVPIEGYGIGGLFEGGFMGVFSSVSPTVGGEYYFGISNSVYDESDNLDSECTGIISSVSSSGYGIGINSEVMLGHDAVSLRSDLISDSTSINTLLTTEGAAVGILNYVTNSSGILFETIVPEFPEFNGTFTTFGEVNLLVDNGGGYNVANFSSALGGDMSISNEGVHGVAGGGIYNYGVVGDIINPSSETYDYGIFGYVPDGTGVENTYAGFFFGDTRVEGDLLVSGTISKGGGTFKIDHPSDPENKYLVHSFIESPDMMNVYNGNITTDENGNATVELPEYFETLNKEFRYQLTVMGTFAQAIIKDKVSDNHFTIMTNQPNVEVSWQVTGIRKDPWANANRVVPELEKSTKNKGKYLHPKLYGKTIKDGISIPPRVLHDKKEKSNSPSFLESMNQREATSKAKREARMK